MPNEWPAWMRAVGGATGIRPAIGAIKNVPSERWQQLAEIAPLLVGAARPGSPEAGAVMQGYLQSVMALRQQQFREQQQQEAERHTGVTEQLARAGLDLRALEGFQEASARALTPLIGAEAQLTPEFGADPQALQQAVDRTVEALRGTYRVPHEATRFAAPPIEPLISQAKRRRAKAFLAEKAKEFGAQWPAIKTQTRFQAGEWAGLTPQELEERYVLTEPLVTTTGKPISPLQVGGSDIDRMQILQRHLRLAKDAGDQDAIQEYTQQLAELKEAMKISRPTDLTPTAEANLISSLNRQWMAIRTPILELERQVRIMDAGITAARRGDMNAGSQAVLVTFQKILDVLSVVREAEYMRSAQGLGLVSRVEGIIERLLRGGASVPIDELEKFVTLGHEIVKQEIQSATPGIKERIGRVADRYRIPRELVFEDVALTKTATPEPSGTTPRTPETITPSPPGPLRESLDEEERRLQEELKRRRLR